MIGYHYTTAEVWDAIQREGLHIAPIRQSELERFRRGVPDLPPDAIWVWREPLTDEQAWFTLILLAEMHQSHNLVLLEVHYEDWASSSLACKEDPLDTIKLSCDFAVGRLGTGALPIDLIICDVPATSIECIWEVNLLDAMKGRHEILANTQHADGRSRQGAAWLSKIQWWKSRTLWYDLLFIAAGAVGLIGLVRAGCWALNLYMEALRS